MAGKAISTVVNISSHSSVFGIHFRLVVLVAGQARKYGKIGCVRMTLGAGGPLAPVFPRINAKILDIVVEG
jgi:hypothetical protein